MSESSRTLRNVMSGLALRRSCRYHACPRRLYFHTIAIISFVRMLEGDPAGPVDIIYYCYLFVIVACSATVMQSPRPGAISGYCS